MPNLTRALNRCSALLLVLCAGCSSYVSVIKQYKFGDYDVKLLKQYSPTGFGGYNITPAIDITYRARQNLTRQDLSEWMTDDLNLSLRQNNEFIYLEETGKLVVCYTAFERDGYLVGVFDTRNPVFSFRPLRGVSYRYVSGEIAPLALQNARINEARIIWGVPDEQARAFPQNSQACKATFYEDQGVSLNPQVVIDHIRGEVYSRNTYLWRYQWNDPLVPVYRHDPGHPASDQIKRLSDQSTQPKFERGSDDVFLGMTPDRRALWFASFTANRARAQVCIENLASDAWQCVTFESPGVPYVTRRGQSYGEANGYPSGEYKPFIAGPSISFNVIDHVVHGMPEPEVSSWIPAYVKPERRGESWALAVDVETKVIDNVIVGM
jgi:hypothetical protein